MSEWMRYLESNREQQGDELNKSGLRVKMESRVISDHTTTTTTTTASIVIIITVAVGVGVGV